MIIKCTWCELPAVSELEIKPAKYRVNQFGMKAIIKPPQTVPVCQKHELIVEEQPTFYTCGCTYVQNQDVCSFHGRKVRSVKTKLTALQKPV